MEGTAQGMGQDSKAREKDPGDYGEAGEAREEPAWAEKSRSWTTVPHKRGLRVSL